MLTFELPDFAAAADMMLEELLRTLQQAINSPEDYGVYTVSAAEFPDRPRRLRPGKHGPRLPQGLPCPLPWYTSGFT